MTPHRMSLLAVLALCASAPAWAGKPILITSKVLVAPPVPTKVGDVTLTTAADGSAAQLTEVTAVPVAKMVPPDAALEEPFVKGLQAAADNIGDEFAAAVDEFADPAKDPYTSQLVGSDGKASPSVLDQYAEATELFRDQVEAARSMCADPADAAKIYQQLLDQGANYFARVQDLAGQAGRVERQNFLTLSEKISEISKKLGLAVPGDEFVSQLPGDFSTDWQDRYSDFRNDALASTLVTISAMDRADFKLEDAEGDTKSLTINAIFGQAKNEIVGRQTLYTQRRVEVEMYGKDDFADALQALTQKIREGFRIGRTMTTNGDATTCDMRPSETDQLATPEQIAALEASLTRFHHSAVVSFVKFADNGIMSAAAVSGCEPLLLVKRFTDAVQKGVIMLPTPYPSKLPPPLPTAIAGGPAAQCVNNNLLAPYTGLVQASVNGGSVDSFWSCSDYGTGFCSCCAWWGAGRCLVGATNGGHCDMLE